MDVLLVAENLDESDQFILVRDFIKIFDVTINFNNVMFRNGRKQDRDKNGFACELGLFQ